MKKPTQRLQLRTWRLQLPTCALLDLLQLPIKNSEAIFRECACTLRLTQVVETGFEISLGNPGKLLRKSIGSRVSCFLSFYSKGHRPSDPHGLLKQIFWEEQGIFLSEARLPVMFWKSGKLFRKRAKLFFSFFASTWKGCTAVESSLLVSLKMPHRRCAAWLSTVTSYVEATIAYTGPTMSPQRLQEPAWRL